MSRRLANLELAAKARKAIKLIDTDGTLLFRAVGDYSQPRCSVWHHEANFLQYPDHWVHADGNAFGRFTKTRCPMIKHKWPLAAIDHLLGSGFDTELPETPCVGCPWFKIVPRQ